MKSKRLRFLCFGIIIILILSGCGSDNRDNKEKEKDEVEKSEEDAQNEIPIEYTKEVDQMGGLLSYLAYAIGCCETKFPNGEAKKSSNEIIQIDNQIISDTIYMMLELRDFEDLYQYDNLFEDDTSSVNTDNDVLDEDVTSIVQLTNGQLNILQKDMFMINGVYAYSPSYKTFGSIKKSNLGYDFYLKDLGEKQVSFDIVSILAIDVEKNNFLLKVKLQDSKEDTLNELAQGEIIMSRNTNSTQFPFAVKSMKLKYKGSSVDISTNTTVPPNNATKTVVPNNATKTVVPNNTTKKVVPNNTKKVVPNANTNKAKKVVPKKQ